MENKITRRHLLKIGTTGILATSFMAKAADMCGLTPKQPEGPFYPEQDQLDKDVDLTRVQGSTKSALGEVVIVQGIVTDQNCEPVKGALVEIWQACASGKYNHKSDPNDAPLDPNFQYWGQALTNENGEYSFKTIIPGAYPADTNWIRPPHIHFKIERLGYHELITQMYFSGNALNRKDLILQSLPINEQEKVIVDFVKVEGQQHPMGLFNITLQKA